MVLEGFSPLSVRLRLDTLGRFGKPFLDRGEGEAGASKDGMPEPWNGRVCMYGGVIVGVKGYPNSGKAGEVERERL